MDNATVDSPAQPWRSEGRKQLHKPGEGRYRESRGRGRPDKNCGLPRGNMQPIQDDFTGRWFQNNYTDFALLQTSQCPQCLPLAGSQGSQLMMSKLIPSNSQSKCCCWAMNFSCVCLPEQKDKHLEYIPRSWIAVLSLSALSQLLGNTIWFSKMFVWLCTPVSSVW